MLGKDIRLSRIFKSVKSVLVPMDHGVTMGMIKGLENMNKTFEETLFHGVDSVVLHRGLIKNYYKQLIRANVGTIMHLSASTDMGNLAEYKVLTGSVYDAVSYGCDGVSIHVNIGSKYESEMIRDFSKISSECDKYGMPLLVMLYPRGEGVDSSDINNIKHVARIGLELGADMIKIPYISNENIFRELINNTPIPVLVAGGDKQDEEHVLNMVKSAMTCGAKGVSIGRNIFQSDNKKILIQKINRLVHLSE